MLFVFSILAAHPAVYAAATKTKAGANTWIMWALIAVMLVVFYFLLIRPQRRRAQEHDQMVTKLEKGDEVVTIGGIHGTIKRISEDTIVLEVAKGVNMTFARSAIARAVVVQEPEEEELPAEEEYEEEEYDEDLEDELEEELEGEEVDQEYDEDAEEYEDEESEPEPDGGKK
jgi:preprotein translocase subunit YajC